MGFRSTITSEHYSGTLPLWFREKYGDRLSFPDGILLASRCEFKIYTNELFEDFHKSLIETGFWNNVSFDVNIAVLHEDGVISKIEIGKNSIKYYTVFQSDLSETDSIWTQ